MSDETVYKAGKANNGQSTQTLVAVAIIVAGLALLAINLLHIQLINFFWPAFIVGPGLLMIWPTHRSTAEKRHALSFLAVPGGMLVALGGLMFAMGLVDYFDAMAYAWPLILAGGAGGYVYLHRFDSDGRAAAKGHRFIRAMVIAFMAMAALFEIVVFHSLGGWWPLLVIGLGVYLLLKNRRLAS
jgi:hypothetical protein